MPSKRKNGFVVLLACFVALVGVLLGAAWFVANRRLSQHWGVQAPALAMVQPTPELVARGHAIANADGCIHCHTESLGGKVMEETALLGTVSSANLTRGGRPRTPGQWALAVRHGLHADGTSLVGMPSQVFTDMSDEDLAAIIAYAGSLPPVAKQHPDRHITFLGDALIAVGIAPLAAAEVKHDTQPIKLTAGVSVERGRYRTRLCVICHGSDFGGLALGFAPAPGPNLTRSGEPGHWTEAEFIRTLRTGVNPAGRKLNKMIMPWDTYGDLTDDDLKSIWAYLQSLPPSTRGTPPAVKVKAGS
jgi:mono/diheme cytochrome c family protein